MIATLLKIFVTNLRRDRVALAMAFLLPVLFFSIFANVFGAQRDPTRKVNVAVADDDQSVLSGKLVKALRAEESLAVRTTTEKDGKGAPLTRATAEATAMRLLERVGIPQKASDYPAQLSGGQQQMLAVGRGLMGKPKLLLLDEVAAGLTDAEVEDMARLIRRLRDELDDSRCAYVSRQVPWIYST